VNDETEAEDEQPGSRAATGLSVVPAAMTWVGSAPRNERYEVALTALARTILEADAAVDGVMISPTTVHVVKGSNTTRYLLSGDARAALARHVEGTGDFEPGRYRLLVPPPGTVHESTAAVLVSVRRGEA